MKNHFPKTTIRISFDTLMEELAVALRKEGFVVSGTTDFQKEFMDGMSMHFKKYRVLAVNLPLLSFQMLSIAASEGIVLPCSVTVVEHYPGEVEIILANPTLMIAMMTQDASLLNLAEQVGHRLGLVIRSLERKPVTNPDLVTSWD